MGWFEFAAAFAAFLLSHAVPVRAPVRPWLQARLGHAGFTLGYSLLSLVVLAWLIGAAGRAHHVQLWGWAAWQTHVPVVVMLPVCLILTLSVARPTRFPLAARGTIASIRRGPASSAGRVTRCWWRWHSGPGRMWCRTGILRM
jgi:uncharacterized membrane protein